MRAILHMLAVSALVLIWVITINAIYGPHPLPVSIPVHFDAAGRPNGWGNRTMIWMFPAIATAVYALMTVVARFPSSFNFPVRVTRENRVRLETTALGMIAWLRLEVVGLFAWIQYETVRFARGGRESLAPLFMPVTLGIIFFTVGWHLTAMFRAGRAGRTF